MNAADRKTLATLAAQATELAKEMRAFSYASQASAEPGPAGDDRAKRVDNVLNDVLAEGRGITSAWLVNKLMEAAFYPGRDPRSEPYRFGCRAFLEAKTNGLAGQMAASLWQPGTPENDAFCAGAEEGRVIWADFLRPVATSATKG